MHSKNKDSGDLNFWISYADLMAGLLFVFILLVGAIVIRYVFVQKDLNQKSQALGLSKSKLSDKNKILEDLKIQFQDSVSMLKESELDINKLKDLLLNQEDMNINLKNTLQNAEQNLTNTQNILLDQESQNIDFKRVVYKLEQNLTKTKNVLYLKDSEIIALGKKLLDKSMSHQMLINELNITKTKIKNLTGIRIRVISKLKEKLGNSVAIDPRSGAITFSSNILFNQNEYKLKPSSQKKLSQILTQYIHTLLFDDEISQYIEQIVIQGHSSSDGSYLYNLELSQKRALEVMKFLYKSDIENRDLYTKYLSASGRSYSDLILNKDGFEDKENSRRIEIKFRIKNEKAIKELGKFFNR